MKAYHPLCQLGQLLWRRPLCPTSVVKMFISAGACFCLVNSIYRMNPQPNTAYLRPPQGGSTGNKYVSVLIRAHPKDDGLLKSLIWNLRHQGKRLNGLRIDFTLVPTEMNTQEHLRKLAADMMYNDARDIRVLNITNEFFLNNVTPQRFRCRAKKLPSGRTPGDMRTCEYDNHMYYLATDIALLDVALRCEACTHVLVTNADNNYSPLFLKDTLRYKHDIIVTDFAHKEKSMVAQLGRGQIDLGAVIFRKSVLEGGRHTFLKALPQDAGPEEVHDADWWFFYYAVQKGATHKIHHKLLFYHH